MRSTRIANAMFVWAFLLGVWALAVPGCGAPIDATTGSVVSATFESAAADETFDILVRLPPGYEGGARRYLVVYQLDATFLDEFARSAGTLSQLSAQGVIDEPIVVGIGHRGDQGPQRNRFVDFVPADPQDPSRTGRAAAFYHFAGNGPGPQACVPGGRGGAGQQALPSRVRPAASLAPESKPDGTTGRRWIDRMAALKYLELASGNQPPRRRANRLHLFPPRNFSCCSRHFGGTHRRVASPCSEHIQNSLFERRLGIRRPASPAALGAVANLVPVTLPFLAPGNGSPTDSAQLGLSPV